MLITADVSRRFWEKVREADEPHPILGTKCMIWTACVDGGGKVHGGKGYGRMSIKRRLEAAHRVSWAIHCGDIPDGMCVLHKCDVRTCVNPEHLFLGTVDDNNKDMASKLRGTHGTKAYAAKLSDRKVVMIRHLVKNGMDASSAGRLFGVTKSVAREAASRRSWKHVRDDAGLPIPKAMVLTATIALMSRHRQSPGTTI